MVRPGSWWDDSVSQTTTNAPKTSLLEKHCCPSITQVFAKANLPSAELERQLVLLLHSIAVLACKHNIGALTGAVHLYFSELLIFRWTDRYSRWHIGPPCPVSPGNWTRSQIVCFRVDQTQIDFVIFYGAVDLRKYDIRVSIFPSHSSGV